MCESLDDALGFLADARYERKWASQEALNRRDTRFENIEDALRLLQIDGVYTEAYWKAKTSLDDLEKESWEARAWWL